MNKTLQILFFFFGSIGFGQNLIPNPSFEIFNTCPTNPTYIGDNQISLAIGWTHPTLGTSDLFSSCADNSNIWTSVNVPNAYTGYQNAYDGNSYAGFYAYGFSEDDYGTEYLQAKLTTNLMAGKAYKLSFHISLGNNSEFCIKEIGAYFSVNQISRNDFKNFNYLPQVKSNSFLTDTSGWILVSGVFIANGGEEFITIGNFQDSITTDTLNTNVINPAGENFSYYFIDGVILEEYSDEELYPNIFTPNNDGENDYFLVNTPFKRITVYNRWGNNIWQGSTGQSWNGKAADDTNVIDGIYYYIIEYENRTHHGFVQVVR